MAFQRPFLPVYAVELRLSPCPCERSCGGLRLAVREALTADRLMAGQPTVYDHLSAAEALDVADAVIVSLDA